MAMVKCSSQRVRWCPSQASVQPHWVASRPSSSQSSLSFYLKRKQPSGGVAGLRICSSTLAWATWQVCFRERLQMIEKACATAMEAPFLFPSDVLDQNACLASLHAGGGLGVSAGIYQYMTVKPEIPLDSWKLKSNRLLNASGGCCSLSLPLSQAASCLLPSSQSRSPS